MEIAEILKPDAIRVVATYSSKKRLFMDIGELASSVYDVAQGDAVDALQDRESLGPTGVGHGVALPHARIVGLTQVRGLFIRSEKPLDFDAVDRQPVDLFFALLAPEDAGVEHLKALALVSRTMRDPSLCAKLRANTEPATLHAVLTETPATKAA